MLTNTNFIAYLDLDNKTLAFPAEKMTFYDECYADFQLQKVGKGWRCQVMLHAKQPLDIRNFRLELDYQFKIGDRIFCNGYQSWSESTERQFGEPLSRIRWGKQRQLTYFGDDHIEQVQRGKSHLHAWTYSYVRRAKQPLFFIGSASEATGFTLIQFDQNNQKISIEKDCAGLQLSHSFPILDVWFGSDTEQKCFAQWFDLQDVKLLTTQAATGWTSWYHHYVNISEEVILKNLTAFQEREIGIDIFQIDDGWQRAVGDWLDVREVFPNGMGKVAADIQQAGYRAGLWLAPFICVEQSAIFQKNQHWLLKDAAGKPISLGYIPLWKSKFYALDFYQKEVQDYLRQVFQRVFQHWQYDLVKLDFLYAVCIAPPPHKTRGQVMHDAMEFLRQCCGDKLILGCGVPLGSAFGKVDYCRIGGDVHLQWEDQLLRFFHHRERVSTIATLRNTLHRWQLSGKAFYNDPDVFILRQANQKLTPTQQYTLLIINVLCGDVLFTSDDVADYSAEQWSEYQSIFKWKNSEIQEVRTLQKDVFAIDFLHDKKGWTAYCNLTNKSVSVKPSFLLEPYESIILK
ncbi:MAG: glycoside hydrolase family 36 protein [Saprospiraceae bacterium]